jgi:hypothetical protein
LQIVAELHALWNDVNQEWNPPSFINLKNKVERSWFLRTQNKILKVVRNG